LTDSFEEKAFCFNQALACNPENEVARVGLASLESIMQAVSPNPVAVAGFDSPEIKEEFEAAHYINVEQEESSANALFEEDAAEGPETQEFHFEPAEAHEIAVSHTAEAAPAVESSDVAHFDAIPDQEALSSFDENAAADLLSFESQVESSAMPESAVSDDELNGYHKEQAVESFDTSEAYDQVDESAQENELGGQIKSFAPVESSFFEEIEAEPAHEEELKFEPFDSSQVEELSFGHTVAESADALEAVRPDAPESVVISDEEESNDAFIDSGIKAETFYLGSESKAEVAPAVEEPMIYEENSHVAAPAVEEIPMPVVEQKVSPEMSAQLSLCPFCSAENNINHEICGGCHAVLGMYNLDMLLSNSDVDQDKVTESIEFMEAHLEDDSCSAEEFFNLGLAHLNLKNMDEGMKYLQKSYILNSTNSFLKAQIDELAKRMGSSDHAPDEDVNEGSSVGSKTIMVVDDSATIRKLVSAKLEKHGHTVVAAVDGMEALAKLEEMIPDLILLDITMPRLDGYQVCKLIRANENTRFVPIILISGKDGFFDKVRGKMCGSTSYITKPFGPEMLLKAVEAYSK
jgi:CheY-like chemotaxis protein